MTSSTSSLPPILGILLNPEIRTGAHRRYLELMDSLGERGHAVTLVCSPAAARFLQNVSPIISSFPGWSARLPFSVRALLEFHHVRRQGHLRSMERTRTGWILLHGESHFLAGWYAKILTRWSFLFAFRSNSVAEQRVRRRALSLSARSVVASYRKEMKAVMYELAVGLTCESISFQSPVDRNSFLARVPWAQSRTNIIPGNIGPPRFDPQLSNTNRSTSLRSIIYVGALGWRKDVATLVRAFSLCRKHGYDVCLEIVGFGDEEAALHVLTRELGIADFVTFHGRVTNPLQLVARSDVFVNPALFDSFPDSILEALHVGTPVVATRVGGVPYQVGSDEYLCQPALPEALAHRIMALARSPSAYQEARNHARKQARQFQFDWTTRWQAALSCNPPRP